MRVVIHREALDEITAASDYYDGIDVGLRTAFTDELELAVERIGEFPQAWPVLTSGIHHYLLRHFPFSVIYALSENSVLVLAIMHFSRKPGYWKHRLET